MIYTLGHTESYKKILKENKIVFKVGREIDGVGGIAFKNKENANKYIIDNNKKTWSVFGLDCEWDNTYYLKEEDRYAIIKDTRIIKI